MNLKKKVLSVVAAGALATGLVFAQAGGGHHGMWRAHRMAFLTQQLNLTDAQQAAAKDIFSQARKDAQPIMDQLKQGHEAVAAAVKAGKSDAELTQLSEQQGVLMGQLAAIRTKAMAKFYAQLTPDQKTKADQLQAQRKARFEQFRKNHQAAQPQQ